MEIEINFVLKQESIENYKKTQEYINALAADLVKYNLKKTGINSFKGIAAEHNWHEIDVVIYCHEDFIEACEELNIIYFKNGEKIYEDMLEPVKKYKNYFEEREKKYRNGKLIIVKVIHGKIKLRHNFVSFFFL